MKSNVDQCIDVKANLTGGVGCSINRGGEGIPQREGDGIVLRDVEIEPVGVLGEAEREAS